MILLAGLAVAGLAGIAAAFYFSVRPGGSRVRAAGPGRAEADGLAGSSGPSPASSARSARSTSRDGRSAGRSIADSSGPTGPGDDPGRPAAARRPRRTASRARPRAADIPAEWELLGPTQPVLAPVPAAPVPAVAVDATNETRGAPKAGSQPEALLADPADAGGDAKPPRSRRRVGWRKGAEVDEELWPAEAFGGVTDEQFWDDLAADKPLTTTARAAQPESGSRSQPGSGSGRRPRGAVPPPDGQASLPGARSDWTATQPAPIAARPTHAARSGVSVEEDPLTSPAYSLRPSGAVDGRSYQPRRSRELSRDQYEAATSQTTQAFSSADIQAAGGGYPGGVPPLRQFEPPAYGGNGASQARSSGYRPDPLRSDPVRSDGYWSGSAGSSPSARTIATPAYRPSPGSADAGAYPYPEQSDGGPQSAHTPPYGERHGYGNPVGPVGDPRQPNGTWAYGQPGGTAGYRNVSARYAYPPAAGYRAPYDPRGNDRR